MANKPMTDQLHRLIGLLGGTFDPIHHGHLRMAQELSTTLQLDEVRFIPAGSPPQKKTATSAKHRANMVAIAIADNPLFTLDEREIKRSEIQCIETQRSEIQRTEIQATETHHSKTQDLAKPPASVASYTIDTLTSLREAMGPDVALCLLMGRDAFLGLPSWHRWQELVKYCHIIVAHRPDAHSHTSRLPDPHAMPADLRSLWQTHATNDLGDLNKAAAGRIVALDITALDISATRIRHAFSAQQSCRYLMPDAVIDYIERHGLYIV